MTAFFSRKLAVSSGFAQANVGVRLGPVSAVADSEAAAAPAAAATTAEAEGSPAERRTAGAAEPLATATATEVAAEAPAAAPEIEPIETDCLGSILRSYRISFVNGLGLSTD